jgi:predicted ABC-type exoprotein transport system permease subunit
VLEALENTQFAAWVRTDLWGWPVALTVHAFGTALVVGFILIIGLRLLGLFEQIPYSALNKLFPVVWAGLVISFLSGFVLWMTKASRYVADGAFVLKFVLIVVGIVLTYYFSMTVKREAGAWETRGAISSRAVQYVAGILVIWCTVLIAGRLTGYLGSI